MPCVQLVADPVSLGRIDIRLSEQLGDKLAPEPFGRERCLLMLAVARRRARRQTIV
jgi:hypothetical protein